MKFISIATITALVATSAQATTVSYDQGYDDASRSMTLVSCSDGKNGLITRKGWKTQGAVANFPLIGGAGSIAGWNSDMCGTCYKLTYQGRSVTITAIDHAAPGTFNLGLNAMGKLFAGGTAAAKRAGRITVDKVEQVSTKFCKF